MEATVEGAAEEVVEQQGQETVTPTPFSELFAKEASSQEGKAAAAEPSPDAEVKTEPEASPEQAEAKAETGKEAAEAKPSPEKTPDDKPEWEQRYWETQRFVGKLGQENAELKRVLAEQARHIEKVSKQMDGEWTDEDEAQFKNQSSATPSVDDVAQIANLDGRIDASREMAISQFGAEEVEKLLFAPDAPFRQIENDPVVRAKVVSSPAPVLEAIKIVKAKSFFDKWGYEPASIESNMRKQMEKELTEKITQDVMKKLNQPHIPKGIGDIKGSNVSADGAFNPTPMSEVFRKTY